MHFLMILPIFSIPPDHMRLVWQLPAVMICRFIRSFLIVIWKGLLKFDCSILVPGWGELRMEKNWPLYSWSASVEVGLVKDHQIHLAWNLFYKLILLLSLHTSLTFKCLAPSFWKWHFAVVVLRYNIFLSILLRFHCCKIY